MIEDCGVVKLKEPYVLTEEQITSESDIKKSLTMYTANLWSLSFNSSVCVYIHVVFLIQINPFVLEFILFMAISESS